ncbi:MAG: hypothetical protein HY707_00750 [Ignavibacteriae bacterium]|nr:hypothetical protein [Ignavibacteriota bacterium]
MSTGQTILTIGAFILLSNILITFYRLLAESGETINSSQSVITAVSLATTNIQIAQGLHYDEKTINSFINGQSELNRLTPLGLLGRDSWYGVDSLGNDTLESTPELPPENQIKYFDDFDDFNGWEQRDTTLEGGIFKTTFLVYYVNPDNVSEPSLTQQTFVKRMDMKIWREFPPSRDTLRTSFIMGYWMFSAAL